MTVLEGFEKCKSSIAKAEGLFQNLQASLDVLRTSIGAKNAQAQDCCAKAYKIISDVSFEFAMLKGESLGYLNHTDLVFVWDAEKAPFAEIVADYKEKFNAAMKVVNAAPAENFLYSKYSCIYKRFSIYIVSGIKNDGCCVGVSEYSPSSFMSVNDGITLLNKKHTEYINCWHLTFEAPEFPGGLKVFEEIYMAKEKYEIAAAFKTLYELHTEKMLEPRCLADNRKKVGDLTWKERPVSWVKPTPQRQLTYADIAINAQKVVSEIERRQTPLQLGVADFSSKCSAVVNNVAELEKAVKQIQAYIAVDTAQASLLGGNGSLTERDVWQLNR